MSDEADKPPDEHESAPPRDDEQRVPGAFAEATASPGEPTTTPGAPAPQGPPSPILDAPSVAARPERPPELPAGPPSPLLNTTPTSGPPERPAQVPPGPPSPLLDARPGGPPERPAQVPPGAPSPLLDAPFEAGEMGPSGPPSPLLDAPFAAARPEAPPDVPGGPASPPLDAPPAGAQTLWLRQPTTSGGWPAPPAPPAGYLGAPPPPVWPVYAPLAVEPDNGKATAALVLGIAGLVLWLALGFGLFFFVNLPLSILAWIFGVQAGRRVRSGETSRGAGSARAGVVLGIVGVVLGGLALVGWVLAIALTNWS